MRALENHSNKVVSQKKELKRNNMVGDRVTLQDIINLKGGTIKGLCDYARQKGINIPEDPNYALTASELYNIDPLLAYKFRWGMSQGRVKNLDHKKNDSKGEKEKKKEEKEKGLRDSLYPKVFKLNADKDAKIKKENRELSLGVKKPKKHKLTRTSNPKIHFKRTPVKSITSINSIGDVDAAIECFAWPNPQYNRDDDFYVQKIIGNNQELLDYYHKKMRAYFGLDHVLIFGKRQENYTLKIREESKTKDISTEPDYKEVWLPQPLASMVIHRLTKVLKWEKLEDYKYGEKVLVFAITSTKRTRNIIWADETIYGSFHNALQMGNLSDKEMPENVYLGYIVIGKKTANGYYGIQEAVAFETVTSTRPKYLHRLGVDQHQIKRMSLENRTLRIPINDDVWPMLERSNGTFYLYWKKSFDDFYSDKYGCGDSNGLYELVLYNDKNEKVCTQENKAAIMKETYVSEPDKKEFEALVINFRYIREKSKYEESSFKVMKRIEWILDWNCVKFKSGYFVVFPPDNGEVKFKPKAFQYSGVIESFNYLKDYLNERLNPIRCYVEALDLNIYDKIRLDEAIQKFTAVSRQRAIKTTSTTQPPKEAPRQMTFKQALSKAQEMTPEDFQKYKSQYIDYLVTLQSKEYKVIPCVERLAHSNADTSEYAFMFSIECSSGKVLIVHENVHPDRSTLLFLVRKEAFNKSIREIYDFLQSAEINKRSSLRDKSIEIENAGILSYRSINHDDLYSWKQTISTYKRYR